MSEQKPFEELKDDGLDIDAIFGGGTQGSDANPFDVVASTSTPTAEPPHAAEPEQPDSQPATAEQSVPPVASSPAQEPVQPPEPQPGAAATPVSAAVDNPLQAAFDAKTVENAQKGLFEKPPVFNFKGLKEPIEDPTMTFEDLRIQKADNCLELDEGKDVAWCVDYGGVHRDIRDPKGTTIISVKEMIERSPEFLTGLKKSKDKNPDCLVKPKVTAKRKGTLPPYKGHFTSVEDARSSDKRICLIPSSDGRLYELRKTEMGEFIAPKSKVIDFQAVKAGFIPALPLVPMSLMCQIVTFFRSFMGEKEYEAFAMIYWDKLEKRYLAYVPKQTVTKEEVEADLTDCPYDDETRYVQYADIHSHNSMEAFFSAEDDQDEKGTGLYFVVGQLDHFLPDIKARISCNGAFVNIDPHLVIEGLTLGYPAEWDARVTKKEEYQPKDQQPTAAVSAGYPAEAVKAA